METAFKFFMVEILVAIVAGIITPFVGGTAGIFFSLFIIGSIIAWGGFYISDDLDLFN